MAEQHSRSRAVTAMWGRRYAYRYSALGVLAVGGSRGIGLTVLVEMEEIGLVGLISIVSRRVSKPSDEALFAN
jgi:hypothetical protein